MVIAYISVATDEQQLEVQRDTITRYIAAKGNRGVDRWISDILGEKAKETGTNAKLMLEQIQEGDLLVVADITRLCSSLFGMMDIISLCLKKRVALWCINDRYVFDSSLDYEQVKEAFILAASIERSLISMRTKDALSQLQGAGKKLGRPKGTYSVQQALNAQKEEILSMLERGESVKSICEHFKVSKKTFYRFKKNYGLS